MSELFKGGVKPGNYKGIECKHETVQRGKEKINWNDYINANNVDVELYDTLKKYGTFKEEQFDYKAVAGDFDELNDLHETLAKQIKAREMFEQLPLETRQKFNNDINDFVDNGAAYCNELIERDKKAAEEIRKTREQNQKQAENDAANAHKDYIENLKKELGLS